MAATHPVRMLLSSLRALHHPLLSGAPGLHASATTNAHLLRSHAVAPGLLLCSQALSTSPTDGAPIHHLSPWGWARRGRMAAAGAALAAATGLTLVAQADAPAPLQTAPQAVTDEYARPTPKGLPKQITLYQYEVCPFCCKVKAALDYYKLPYKVVEVNPLTKGELKWSSYKKVPVVKLDDEVVIGSSAIISRVAAEVDAARSGGSGSATDSSSSRSTSGTGTGGWGMFGASKPSVGSSGVSAEDETKWRKWVDDWFVKLLTANIYRSWDESWNTFSYITKQTNWSWGTREVARMSGAVLMWQVGKNMPKKYGVQGDLREALYKACDEFVDAVGPNRPFLGGAQPNLADLAVYGVLRAVRETPAFTDAMQHSQIEPWYKRAEAVIGDNSRTSTEGSVQWAVTN